MSLSISVLQWLHVLPIPSSEHEWTSFWTPVQRQLLPLKFLWNIFHMGAGILKFLPNDVGPDSPFLTAKGGWSWKLPWLQATACAPWKDQEVLFGNYIRQHNLRGSSPDYLTWLVTTARESLLPSKAQKFLLRCSCGDLPDIPRIISEMVWPCMGQLHHKQLLSKQLYKSMSPK